MNNNMSGENRDNSPEPPATYQPGPESRVWARYAGGEVTGATNLPPPRFSERVLPSGVHVVESPRILKKGTVLGRDPHTGKWAEVRPGTTYPGGDGRVAHFELLRDWDPDGGERPNVKEHVPYEDQVRLAIKAGLLKLAGEMDKFCQATHGRRPCTSLGELLEEVVKCWHQPSSYSVSNLAQAVESFCKPR